MMINTDILKIKDMKGSCFYGGDQDWYSSNSRAMAGCSSVAGANALRCLCLSDKKCYKIILQSKKMPSTIKRALLSKQCSKDDFLMLMTGIYEVMKSFEIYPFNRIYDQKERNNKFFHIIKPNRGRSSIGFIQGLLVFSNKIGLPLKYNAMPTAFANKEAALEFIKKGLDETGSVSLLTSYNKHSLKTYSSSIIEDTPNEMDFSCPCQNFSMKCHFATITGITSDKLIITTWGRLATIDIEELTGSWHSIKAWESTLFYFEKAASKREALLSVLSSPVPFIKGIIQAIIRRNI